MTTAYFAVGVPLEGVVDDARLKAIADAMQTLLRIHWDAPTLTARSASAGVTSAVIVLAVPIGKVTAGTPPPRKLTKPQRATKGRRHRSTMSTQRRSRADA